MRLSEDDMYALLKTGKMAFDGRNLFVAGGGFISDVSKGYVSNQMGVIYSLVLTEITTTTTVTSPTITSPTTPIQTTPTITSPTTSPTTIITSPAVGWTGNITTLALVVAVIILAIILVWMIVSGRKRGM
jgi:hypothetical protein